MTNSQFLPHKICHIEVDEFCHFGAICHADYSFWKISLANDLVVKAI